MNEPVTFDGVAPGNLIGTHAWIRPYYLVPLSRSYLTSVRCPWTFEARVIETFGDELAVVRFHVHGPWREKAAYYPREMHQGICRCDACDGNGTQVHYGP